MLEGWICESWLNSNNYSPQRASYSRLASQGIIEISWKLKAYRCVTHAVQLANEHPPWNQLNTSHSISHKASQACLVLSHDPLSSPRIQTQTFYTCMLHVPPISYPFIWSLHTGLGKNDGRTFVGRHKQNASHKCFNAWNKFSKMNASEWFYVA